MRSKKSIINSSINIIAFIITLLPNLIIRKLFLKTLGSDMLGLTSLYSNIIGWLSIMELGIGSAIVYSLYKPYANKEYDVINSYINFYGKFYRIIGFIFLLLGIIIAPFIKFFIEGDINYSLASIGLILFIINTFISYMFSHKICILNVAQEAYKITIGVTVSKVLIAVSQYLILKYYPNFIIYILIQIIINLVYFIIINLYVIKNYPWLREKSIELEKYNKITLIKNIKAMFMHKIGSIIVLSTDNIIISKFVGLVELTKYTNYQIIISGFQTLITTGLSGVTASVGNLIAEGDKKKSYDVHKKIFFINFWLSSFTVITLFNTLNQFIVLWIGEDNLLNNFTFYTILVNIYFSSMRGSVEQFQSGSGNFYQDRYAPICEALINLTCSLVLVKYLGIAGVFLGTLISNFMVIFWTKPYVVYKYVFGKNLIEYFKMYIRYLIVSIVPLVITNILCSAFKYDYSVVSFILNCLINIVVINTIYIVIFYSTDEFKYYLNIMYQIISESKNKILTSKFI